MNDDARLESSMGERLEAAINCLPDKNREALLCKGIKDLTALEAAAALGVPTAELERRVEEAKRLLAEMLGYSGDQKPHPLFDVVCDAVVWRMANPPDRDFLSVVREWFGSRDVPTFAAPSWRVAVVTMGLIVAVVAAEVVRDKIESSRRERALQDVVRDIGRDIGRDIELSQRERAFQRIKNVFYAATVDAVEIAGFSVAAVVDAVVDAVEKILGTDSPRAAVVDAVEKILGTDSPRAAVVDAVEKILGTDSLTRDGSLLESVLYAATDQDAAVDQGGTGLKVGKDSYPVRSWAGASQGPAAAAMDNMSYTSDKGQKNPQETKNAKDEKLTKAQDFEDALKGPNAARRGTLDGWNGRLGSRRR